MKSRPWIPLSSTVACLLAIAFSISKSADTPKPNKDLPGIYPATEAIDLPELPPPLRKQLDEAGALLSAGRFGQALRLYEKAKESTRGDPAIQMEVLIWLGLTSKKLGDFHRALSFYAQALLLARQSEDQASIGLILHNIGACHTSLGEPQLALDALEDALAVRTAAWDRASTLTAIATLNDLNGDHVQAIDLLRQAFALRRASLGQTASARLLGQATTLDRLGTAAKNAGKIDIAKRAFESSLTLLHGSPFVTESAIVRANLGRLLVQIGDPGAGLPFLHMAEATLAERGRRHDQAIALLGIAQAYQQTGAIENARNSIGRGIEVVESIRGTVKRPSLRSVFLSSHRTFFESAIELEMQDQSESRASYGLRALELAEQAKARSLLDLLLQQPRSEQAGEASPLLEQIRPVQESLRQLEHRRLAAVRHGALLQDLAAIEKAQRSLILQHEDALGDLDATSQPAQSLPVLEAREIQALLDPGTVFLIYSLGEKRSFVWRVSSSEIIVQALAPKAEIEKTAREAHSALALSDQPGGSVTQPVAELADLLLPWRLSHRRLVIVPDGILHAIPFAVLPEPRTGRALVQDHSLIMLPSVSILKTLRQRGWDREQATKELAVIADPVYSPKDSRLSAPVSEKPWESLPTLERLSHSTTEARRILELVPGPDSLGLLGFDAQREAVGSGLEPFKIVHLSVHGELVEDRPELTSLVFSRVDHHGQVRDGRLFMHEIAALSLPCELIVLSACNSALGKLIQGEGFVGLTRAFFLAGANRALVSLWYVDDEATAELMVLFYRALLLDRLGPAEALRKAQLGLPDVDPRWRAPYYWAGFVLQGDWRWSDDLRSDGLPGT